MKRTPLFALHQSLGARLAPFGGFEMPVHYPDGIGAEHRAVREGVGVFDVSHMGEFEVTGPDRNAFVQRVTSNDVGALAAGQAQYTAILTAQGTFVDDCVVYRFADRLVLVVNAANIARDWAHLVAHKRGNTRLRDVSDDTGLLAVQGPGAEALVAPLASAALPALPYYHFVEGKVAGTECFISRTGYTGEDGFELYCRASDLERLWHALAGPGRARPCGLGARDTLRLEAGYPLYGNDIDEHVTPFEAGLGWIVKLDKGVNFLGMAALQQQKLEGVARRLVGFRVLEPRVVARPGHDVYVDDGKVDVVRSGTVTPTTGSAVGLTYLPVAHARPGATFTIDVRGRRAAAEVVRLPFVPHRTRRASRAA
jgi:glycine cleavage system T protein (aminomethyltransferase)